MVNYACFIKYSSSRTFGNSLLPLCYLNTNFDLKSVCLLYPEQLSENLSKVFFNTIRIIPAVHFSYEFLHEFFRLKCNKVGLQLVGFL